jgi:hypothetical protein
MADLEWFFVDRNGGRQGPCAFSDLRQAYASGLLTPESLVWNANMAGWEPLQTQSQVLQQLKPAAAAPSPSQGRGPPAGGPPGPQRIAMPGMGAAPQLRPAGSAPVRQAQAPAQSQPAQRPAQPAFNNSPMSGASQSKPQMGGPAGGAPGPPRGGS